MKIRVFFRSIVYLLLISIFIIFEMYFENYVEKYVPKYMISNRQNSDPLSFLQCLTRSICYIMIGLILGFENLLYQIKKNGNWRLQLPKIVFLWLPSLYIALAYLVKYSDMKNLYVFFGFVYMLIDYIGNTVFVIIFLILLGYSTITSFYKE